MRLGPTHPLAALLANVGWTALAVPMSAFAGAVTFGMKAGAVGALLGLFLGTGMGLAFVFAWQWIGSHSSSREDSTLSTPPATSDRSSMARAPTPPDVRSQPGRPLSVPPQRARPDVVHGAAALDGTFMELQQDGETVARMEDLDAGGKSSPADVALAIHKAALSEDLDRALAILRNSWDRREQMYLDPSTALAVGECATTRGDFAVGRWCLAQGKGANPQRVASLEQRLSAFPDAPAPER